MFQFVPQPARARATGVLVVLALLVAGCTSGGEAEAPTTESDSSAVESGGASPAEESSSSTPAASSEAAEGEPLASETIDLPVEYGGTLTVSVLALEVQDNLTVLELQLLAQARDLTPGPFLGQIIGNPTAARALAPELLDTENLKAYSEVEEGISLQESLTIRPSNGQTIDLTFYYAAPEDEVATFDVVVGTGLPTFRSVPVQP